VAGLPDFSRLNIPKQEKIHDIATKLPMAVKYTNLQYYIPKWA
jgi:hypothetical protein